MRAWTRARRRRSPRGLILLYHRVAGPRVDPLLLDVSVANFSAQLDVLRSWGTVLPLDDFESHRLAGSLPPRSVAITFDDGYADNLHAAAPELIARQLPATVFVTSGAIGASDEFWWDDVERICSAPRLVGAPPIMQSRWTGDDGGALDDGGWNLLAGPPRNARQRLFVALVEGLQPLNLSARESARAALRAWASVPERRRDSHRAMERGEVAALGALPGISIGAHTVHHLALAGLAPVEQATELLGARLALEEIVGRPVDTVAYPFGTRAEVSAATVDAARASGFRYALANEAEAAWRGSDPHRIPRFLVRDWSGEEFAERLRRWWSDDA